ncbi:hypothetical protein A245_09156, partial [Pseudomonas syringae pv. actinidiae ICMP 19096]
MTCVLVQRAADDIGRRHPVARQFQRTMAQTGHVQQVLYITVQALGLVAGAFQQLAAILQRNGFAQ